jgi:hypothetical protein
MEKKMLDSLRLEWAMKDASKTNTYYLAYFINCWKVYSNRASYTKADDALQQNAARGAGVYL